MITIDNNNNTHYNICKRTFDSWEYLHPSSKNFIIIIIIIINIDEINIKILHIITYIWYGKDEWWFVEIRIKLEFNFSY